MKVLLTGGGSAGHVTPNLSIIEQLEDQGHTCSYIGSYKGIEKEMLKANFPELKYYSICSGKLRRYFSLQNFIDPLFIIIGLFQSVCILLFSRPNLVFSKGGFVSAPVIIAAYILRIPTAIHESDTSPGLATKITSKFAKQIFVSNPDALPFFSSRNKKVTLVDLPIRKFLQVPKSINKTSKKRLLVMGGSLGAKTLNNFILDNFQELTKQFYITHLTGKDHYRSMPNSSENYQKFDFVNQELADIYSKTDIALCRAGATTLNELKHLEIPAVLVPLPTSQSRGEQLTNAQQYSQAHPAEIIPDEKLSLPNFLVAVERVENKKFSKVDKKSSIVTYLLDSSAL